MILGIAEDFTSSVVLDAQLKSIPPSGLCLNSGVHPSITIDNLLAFLPLLDVTFVAWDIATTYEKYDTGRNRSNIVTYSGKIYQSLVAANVGNQPDTSTSQWLETNIESLRLKSLIETVKDRVYSELNLTKRLVNNQYLYESADTVFTLPNDYAAWIFEAKGSDYVTFKLNQAAIQKSGTTPINLYVVNQGVLVDTLTITPSNGLVDFKDLNYTFSGKGQWKFIIDATDVYSNGNIIDPLKYDGFYVYTANGTGATPQSATFNYQSTGNGLGFNVSVYVDSQKYIDNNLDYLANFVRACFELVSLNMFLANSNNRSNRQQWIQDNTNMLIMETKELNANTVAKKFMDEKKRALRAIERTFDTQLSEDEGIEIEVSSL